MGETTIKDVLLQELVTAVKDDFAGCVTDIILSHPKHTDHGDYATAVAMEIGKKVGMAPLAVAEKLRDRLDGTISAVATITIAGPGFLNFYLARSFFSEQVMEACKSDGEWGRGTEEQGQEILFEYTSPNLFKPLHVGNLVGNIVGESMARLFEMQGATVRRINYPSDIGLTVAKGVWGLRKSSGDPASIADLGTAYRFGNEAHTLGGEAAEEIEAVNQSLYAGDDAAVVELWERGKETSLTHLNALCQQLGTQFDTVLFESDAGPIGRALVLKHTGGRHGIFEKDAGAVIFRGEKHGLHTRVFINSRDLPTYEAKDLGNFLLKQKQYPDWTRSVVVTGNEQREYFQVIIAAIRAVFSINDDRSLEHIATGFLTLAGGEKMSSRKGNVLTGESLLADLREEAVARAKETRADDVQALAEQIAVAALKYQILRQTVGSDIVFDVQQAFSFDGDSGPYLQYSHARALSVVAKAGEVGVAPFAKGGAVPDVVYPVERLLCRFGEVVATAMRTRSPHHMVAYLTELAGGFNSWYAVERIAATDDAFASYKVLVARAVACTLKQGLWLLGIVAPEKM